MNPFIQCGGHVPKWFYGLRVVGLFGLGFALLLLWQQHLFAAIFLALAAIVFAAALEVYLFSRARQRRYLQDTGKGFVYRDRHGEARYLDTDVHAFSLRYTNRYSQGLIRSQTRHLCLWVDGRTRPLHLVSKMQLFEDDPLAEVLRRIIASLENRAEQTLEKGGKVQGQGWELTAAELTVQRGRVPEPVFVRDLSAAEFCEGKLCLWRRGEDLPFIRIPAAARNVDLLKQLLDRRIQRPSEKDAALIGSLGRILFERRAPFVHRLTAALATAFGVFLIGGGTLRWSDDASVVSLIAGSVFFILGGLFVWHYFVERFRCHEFGVHSAGLFGRRNLYYRDVASFTYQMTRHSESGSYTHTSLKMRFVPIDISNAKPIRYQTRSKHADEDLDALRDHISSIIAAGMAENFNAGKSVHWTTNLTFHPKGLEYCPKSLIGTRKPPQTIPYDDISGFNIHEGVFNIWQRDVKKPIMQEQVAGATCCPGLGRLMRRYGQRAAKA